MEVSKIAESREHIGPIYSLGRGLKDNQILTGSSDSFVAQWNLEDLSQDKFAVKVNKAVYSVCCVYPHVYIGDSEGGLTIVDAFSGQQLKYYTLHKRGLFRIKYNSTTKHVYTLGGEGSLGIWRGLELVRQIPLSEEKLRALTISNDGTKVFVAGNAGIIHALDTDMFNEVETASVKEPIYSLSFHPTKPLLISGAKDAYLRFHHLDNELEVVREIPAHNFGIYDMAFSNNGRYGLTVSFDKTVKLWDSNSFDSLVRLDVENGGHSSSVNACRWVNQTSFITVGDDRRIIKWQINE
jgi:WD40 repeat protein